MPYVYFDTETRSSTPIKDSTDAYFASPDAAVTLCQWAVDDGPVHVWDVLEPLGDDIESCGLGALIDDPTMIFVAANFIHDEVGLRRILKRPVPFTRWRCVRVQSNAHGLPGGLDGMCAALGVPTDQSKGRDGARLIQIFCVPHKGKFIEPWEQPDEWEKFKKYGQQDIVAMRAAHKRLPSANYRGANLAYFELDARINARGFKIDIPLVEAAVALLESAKLSGDETVGELTGGKVTAVTQRDKLLAYFLESGLQLPNLRKSEIEAALGSGDLSPEQRFLLEARLEGARASGAKYKRALKINVGGRIRYSQQCSGAGRTGRTAHKGFQPGNMPRAVTYNPLAATLAEQHVPLKASFIDEILLPAIRSGDVIGNAHIFGGPNTVAANALRHTLIADDGCEFTVADYKNIESRILAWLANEEWKLDAYRFADANPNDKSRDLYRLLYSRFFGVDVGKVSDHERQSGKVVELACGFGGSVGAFVAMAVGYGMDLSILPALVLANASPKVLAKAEKAWWRAFLEAKDFGLQPEVFMACHALVQGYRTANPGIDGLKRAIGRGVENCIRERGSLVEVGRCKIFADAKLLIVELPSGYRLCYWSPVIETEKVVDPEDGEEETRTYLSFLRARGSKMIRERSWSGLILENIVQATGNQVLRYGKLEVDKVYPDTLVLAVHDEAVAEAPRGVVDLRVFEQALCKGWNWSRGLPLSADGWVGPRYGKR